MSRTEEARSYPTSAFDYPLPQGLVASRPAARRDESRLLVLERATGRITHRIFRDLARLIPAGDALVLNETRVFPARLLGRKPTGAPAEILLLRPLEGEASRAGEPAPRAAAPALAADTQAGSGPADARVWEALVRPGGKLKPGRVVEIGEELRVEILDAAPDGTRVVRLHTPLAVRDALARYGRTPLPPYIARAPEPEDAERYQTVYARADGSVAAPTAGLHFTPELLAALEAAGVRLVRLVLHVGVGTFRPVEVEDPADHRMHAERYAVPADAAAALNETRARGGAVWAVGTTVARALETVTDERGVVRPGEGWTDLFIRPPYRFRGVDRLVTNFHLPRSTLLMLVAAFGGYERVMEAYREAVRERYRFYSYGDAMVVV
ncbi:MAG TPA: tRNA preQ1(34) S-adenosylmethionine ribosyltransferase-isomerase QueA [Longimicrobiales bacterium]